jgi:hypothetical protein
MNKTQKKQQIKEDNDYQKINLGNLLHGSAEELFEESLKKVIENIEDLNTNHKAKREIVIKLTIEPTDENRSSAVCSLDVQAKLAPRRGYSAPIVFGRENTEIFAYQMPRQMPLFTEPELEEE